MAYTDFAGGFEAPKSEGGAFRRWIAGLFAAGSSPSPVLADPLDMPAPRKLAGPDPRDRRARGYMADLDIEVGF